MPPACLHRIIWRKASRHRFRWFGIQRPILDQRKTIEVPGTIPATTETGGQVLDDPKTN